MHAAVAIPGDGRSLGTDVGICPVAGMPTLGLPSLVLFLGSRLVLLFKSMADMPVGFVSLTKMDPEGAWHVWVRTLCVWGGNIVRRCQAAWIQIMAPTATSCVAWGTSPVTSPTLIFLIWKMGMKPPTF